MERLRGREIYRDSLRRLIAVETVALRRETQPVRYIHGSIEPVALVVCAEDSTFALDMEGEPTDIRRLKRDVPGLEALLSD